MADPPPDRRRLLGHLQKHESERGPRGMLPERFRLIRELGRGAMGAVVLVHDAQLDRQVAVKILLAADCATLAQRQRFETEGKALASLHHPHIVQVHELVRDQGALFLIMDYVEGESLAQRMVDDKLEPREAARVALAVAKALGCAHEHGVLHRDVKPANVMLSSDGGVFLVDFGLAKQINSSLVLTKTGQMMGTPDYCSLEQATDAKAVDERSDIYSLGASLFHALTGSVVFPGHSLSELLQRLVVGNPPDPRDVAPDVPADLAAVCLRCLQKDPAGRYPDAKALADDLGAFLRGEPIRDVKFTRTSRRMRLGLATAAALIVLTLLGLVATNPTDVPRAVEHDAPKAEHDAPKEDPEAPAAEATQPARPSRQVLAHEDVMDLTFVAGRSDLIVSVTPSSVRMWELDPVVRQRWESKQVGVTWSAASPDGRIIACGKNVAVVLLSGDDGRELATVQIGKITRVGLWIDDGRELLLGSVGPSGLQRVRTSDWTLLPTKQLDYTITCLAFDPRSGTIAWGGGRREQVGFKRLGLSRGALEPLSESLETWGFTAMPKCIAPGRTPDEWVVGLMQGKIHILRQTQPGAHSAAPPDTALIAPLESFPPDHQFVHRFAHVGGVGGLGFLHNGMLVSSTKRPRMGDLRVWDLEQPQPLVGLAIRRGLTIRAMKVSPDGHWVALGTQLEGVIVLSAESVVKLASQAGSQLGE